MDTLYPAGPDHVPADLTQPSKHYKQRAWLAVSSLAAFVLLYFALASWFGWTAYRLINIALEGGKDSFWLFLFGSCSGFLTIFMLKALFFVRRGHTSDDVELAAEEQPHLFNFLYRLADEAGAPRPRRVFLSARVNAAVFYDLSILNFFFPSQKNLEIGVALVNVLTLSEMKAVLAHEFGHFAQRSMAIGSWIYIAQQVAAHVIAKRDALDRLLRVISNFDVRIAWIGWLLSLIVWSIRSLMDTVFRLVMLAQRALSRQMEFQADLVAVSLTGSDELVHSLHKLQAADEAWGRALSFANAEARQGRAIRDLFLVQSHIIKKIAQILDDDAYGKIPASTSSSPAQRRLFKSGFAQPPQMWATHPANSDREENAKQTYLPAPHDNRSAWVLFADAAALRERLSATFFAGMEIEAVADETTLAQLNERYGLSQYDTGYRGAYLGRALTRHSAKSADLYLAEEQLGHDTLQALASLYPEALADDLSLLRALEEELAALQALRDRVYQATGSKIVYRGREIARRELPAAIRDVTQEVDTVRRRILGHDRKCRSAHLAASKVLDCGWHDYLIGLIDVLHYAEHTLADLEDSHGLLGNTVAVVTADGNVSAKELKRLLAVANQLHEVMATIYAQASDVRLDATLATRLELTEWTEALEEFKLPPAAEANINDWMRVIDGWVGGLTGSLAALASAALGQLLMTEAQIAQQLWSQLTPEPAPARSQVPANYTTLIPGHERKRQRRLGWWDRFQTADGFIPAVFRLLVASAIVGTVLGVGSLTGTVSVVSIYNGLAIPVAVHVGDHDVSLPRFSGLNVDVQLEEGTSIEARNAKGELIEQFTPQLSGHTQHYIYNIASASPLIEWTAVYGDVPAKSPRYLGAARWLTSSADVFFTNPPQSIGTSGRGGSRTVVSGAGEESPNKQLRLVDSEPERHRMVLAHLQWDEIKGPHTGEWQAAADLIHAKE